MSQVSHTFIVDSIWLKIFFFPWNYGVAYGHVLRASRCISKWRASPRVVFRFDVDATSSWWRTQIARSACSSWNQSPSSLVLPHSPNSRTLVILLQINLISGDELETICEGCYKTQDTTIFAWSSILGVGHHHWLRDSICRLPPNSKANYLVRTIRRILDFLQLWIIIMPYIKTPHVIAALCWAEP